ncbi:MAG: hypothetical protein K0S09_456 [Sphingobacteriaceae bacterium]|nr:hypothetical protein [Sphingobacteriaceae bacterium]
MNWPISEFNPIFGHRVTNIQALIPLFFYMMNKKEIFTKIGTIVNEIYEQYNYLSEHPDNLNELELELFLANSKFLAGHIEVFQKLNRAVQPEKPAVEEPQRATAPKPKPVESQAPAEKQPEAVSEPEPQQPKPGQEENVTRFVLDAEPVEDEASETEAEPAHAPEPQPEPEKEEPAAQQPQTAIEEPVAPEPQPEPKKEEPAIAEPTAPEPVAEQAPVVQEVVIEEKTIELPKKEAEPEHVPTLNDVISAQFNPQGTLAGQFTAQPVKDLKSIISLNDKLLFVKDLFNGYSLAYSEAIELLNRFDKFEAADTFLKTNYATKNNWAAKQSTVEHFYEILSRRFGR